MNLLREIAVDKKQRRADLVQLQATFEARPLLMVGVGTNHSLFKVI